MVFVDVMLTLDRILGCERFPGVKKSVEWKSFEEGKGEGKKSYR